MQEGPVPIGTRQGEETPSLGGNLLASMTALRVETAPNDQLANVSNIMEASVLGDENSLERPGLRSGAP